MRLNLIWRTLCVHLSLHLARPITYIVLGLLVLWSIPVPGIGINKGDFAARERELGYPPISDSALAGLGAAQVASGLMTLAGVLLLLDNLDRERESNLDEVLASLPVSGWSLIALQYLSNLVTLLLLAFLAYAIALIAYPFRGFDALVVSDLFWPGFLFPLGTAFLLAALPLCLDVLGFHQIRRAIAYGVIALVLNLGPYALAVATHLDHPRHPLVQLWSTAYLGVDTVGVWYVRGYGELKLRVIEQFATPTIPPRLFWTMVLRPRLVTAVLGMLLAAVAAWRFDRFQIAPER